MGFFVTETVLAAEIKEEFSAGGKKRKFLSEELKDTLLHVKPGLAAEEVLIGLFLKDE